MCCLSCSLLEKMCYLYMAMKALAVKAADIYTYSCMVLNQLSAEWFQPAYWDGRELTSYQISCYFNWEGEEQ